MEKKTILVRKEALKPRDLESQETIITPLVPTKPASKQFQTIVGLHFRRAGQYMEQGRLDRAVECLEDARYLAMTMVARPWVVSA